MARSADKVTSFASELNTEDQGNSFKEKEGCLVQVLNLVLWMARYNENSNIAALSYIQK